MHSRNFPSNETVGMTCYEVGDLVVAADCPLPFLVYSGVAPRAATVSSVGRSAFLRFPLKTGWTWESRTSARLDYAGLGRIWVRDGREIRYEMAAERSAREVFRALGNPAFAALLYQRGYLVLHASAVCIDREAIGFLGFSGSGKSTMLSHLLSSGAEFICDDTMVLDMTGNRQIGIYPGLPLLKLWPDSHERTGKALEGGAPLFPDNPKGGFQPIKAVCRGKPVPLRCLFVLEEGDSVMIEPLSRTDLLVQLLRHTFGVTVFKQKPAAEHFRQCGEVARTVTVKRLLRPMAFDRLAEVETVIRESLADG